uniref:Uncharacterized protein n=1 Tax=viral metagenome TaxID=1070528 RepID=A0A6M3K6L9_9ZZZZ
MIDKYKCYESQGNLLLQHLREKINEIIDYLNRKEEEEKRDRKSNDTTNR